MEKIANDIRFKEVGKYLCNARIRAKLSQKEVQAVLKHKSAQIISDWERGRCGIPFRSMAIICKMYRLDKVELANTIARAERKYILYLLRGVK